MSEIKNGDLPASPTTMEGAHGSTINTFGLTKREYFAAKAMQGLCGMKPTNDERDINKLTVLAVKIADALLTQLSKQQ